MFWETTVNKWDIVNIHSRLLYTIPARWKLTIAFIGLLVTTTNITSFFIPLNVVYCCFEKFCTAISSVIDLLNKFVDWMSFGDGWCLMDAFRLNYFIRFNQVQSNNRWHKFHGRQHQKILWVYGPQSALTLLFGKWRFWWLRLHHPLGLCLGVPHCRTSTMAYSRTLFLLLIVEK